MSDNTINEESVSFHADVVKVNKFLVLPTQFPQRMAMLEKAGCKVSYELAEKSGLTEVYKNVDISGPDNVVSPAWHKMQQDLGIRITEHVTV